MAKVTQVECKLKVTREGAALVKSDGSHHITCQYAVQESELSSKLYEHVMNGVTKIFNTSKIDKLQRTVGLSLCLH